MKLRKLLSLLLILVCFSAFSQKHSKAEKGISNISLKQLIEKQDNSFVITKENTSTTSGIRHVYLRQAINGIEVLGTESSVHLREDGSALKTYNSFVDNISATVKLSSASLSASQAIAAVAQNKGYNLSSLNVIKNPTGINRKSLYSKGGISKLNIPAKLVYFKDETNNTRLAWDVSIFETTSPNWYNYIVDSSNGTILATYNWTLSCNILGDHEDHAHNNNETVFIGPINNTSNTTEVETALIGSYFVYPMPIESPNYGAASVVVDPDNAIASPFGWHDTDGTAGAEFTITRGNNVFAYEDGDNSGFSPDGGAALSFNFPINPTYSGGDQSESGVITNLFYWNNIIHDVAYQYGFDPASGNFQENNYGMGGVGSDSVNAEAQDGSGTCNANMATGPDGDNPTMQMSVCGDRDGDIDNGVVVHEYVHGISSRLTGGANNPNCLFNDEQMGEGWSDYYALMLTIDPTDVATDARPIGTWLIGEGPNDNGIRTFPYSTDFAINSHTYNDINTESIPHGVGSVWAEMLWEMTWEIIAVEGFDTDIYNGTGGNNTALALVTEGLKLQPCSPGFVDGRDAILAADEALYGGSHTCEIWAAFARRGLGFSASQGNTNSRSDGTEAFDLPPSFSSLGVIDEVCLAGGVITGLGGGSPTGGVYSGAGVTDDGNGTTYTFDPSVAGAGPVTIGYSTIDFCSGDPSVLMDDMLVTDEPPFLICKGSGITVLDGSAEESPALNIEDLTTVSTTIEITEDLNITDLNIALDIEHTYVEDMIITLTSPALTSVVIFDGGADGCSGNNVVTLLDDESTNPLICGNPIAYSQPDYIPSNPLAGFNGESTLGTWTLTIQDTFNGDPGILNNWRIDYYSEINSLTLDVTLDINGTATINADQLLEYVLLECGAYTVTAGSPLATTVTFTVPDIGLNNVDVVVTSDSGISSMCVAIVNVIENMDGGQAIFCPDDVTIECGEDTSPVNTGTATAVSICDPNPMITFTDSVEETCGNTQIITRTWFAEDSCGNDIDSCIQIITTEDTVAPTVVCPENIIVDTDDGQCTALVNFDLMEADDCGDITINVINGLPSGSDFPIGTTINQLEIVDGCGNITECSFTVTVENTTIPEAICQNITVQLDASGMVTITAVDVTGGAGTVCSSTNATIDIDTFDCSNIGDNNVILTVVDSDGNEDSCTAVVSVEDTILPEAICAPITIELDEMGIAILTGSMIDGGSTDNCGIVSYDASVTSFDCTMVGDNTVTLTVTDSSGNSSSCDAIVTVVDTIIPTAICQNITVELDADGLATIEASEIDNGSFDNCGNVTVELDITTFNCDNIGTNDVVLLVTDDSGNTSECEAVVTVVDNLAPIAICANITIALDEDYMAEIEAFEVDGGSTDNCEIVSMEIDVTTFNCSNVGDNNVVLTLIDGSGNVSECTAIVTVTEGVFAPNAVCQNVTVTLGEDGTGTVTPSDFDNGSTGIRCFDGLSISQDMFDCDDIGETNQVLFTVTNAAGDTDSCVAFVNVIDGLAPEVVCPEDQTVTSINGPYELPDYFALGEAIATDNCTNPVTVYEQTPIPGTLLDAGTHIITITVQDGNGFEAECSFELTVEIVLGTETNTVALNTITLFPNPANQNVTIGNPQNALVDRVAIYDITGRLVIAENGSITQSKTIDIASLQSGTYLVLIEGENGQITKQLIKE